jgi:hypothetical protein
MGIVVGELVVLSEQTSAVVETVSLETVITNSKFDVGQMIVLNQQVEEEIIEEKEIVPANRQIFNSLINKSTSRYFLDMIKQ